MHVRYASGAPTRDDLIAYAASIDAEIAAHLLPLCSAQVRTAEVMVTDLTSNVAARGILASSAQVGTRAGLPNGAGVAALINFSVARFLPGGAADDLCPVVCRSRSHRSSDVVSGGAR